jgi:flagellar hook-associated protein 1 FlgK
MSGLTGAINTALTGLTAFEDGITTVSNNLSNETTPGYAVENVNLETEDDIPGQPGVGVQTPTIVRAADGFAAGVLRTANSASTAASTQSTALTNISNALLNNGDIQSTLNQFFEDVSTLAANPTDEGAQQTVLSDAQNIVSSFQSASTALTGVQTTTNTSISDEVTSANNLLAQLNTINNALKTAPNDPSLIDQQEAALNSLSQLLPVNVITEDNGGVLVYTGGTALLDQGGAQDLTLTAGNGSTAPTIKSADSPVTLTLTASDGSLGANISSYTASTSALQNLNTLASIVAATVNTAQAEGLTPSGAEGGALFSVPAPSVVPSSANTGSATLTATISNATQLPTNGGPFTLTYATATGWTATDQATGTTYTVTAGSAGTPPATTLAFAGITATINSGAPANGDSFTVNPAPGAAEGIAVVATQPDQIAAADPFVGTPGALQADGSVDDTNAGKITTGTDTVITAAAATTAAASGDALVPASFWDTNTFGSTSLQVVFTSSTAYNVETTAGATIASGTLGSSGGISSGSILISYPGTSAAAGNVWQLPISGSPQAGDVLTISPGGSSSGSNASRLAAQWTNTGVTTAGSLQQSVVDLSTTLGANAQAAQNLATQTAAQVTSATANLQTIAGVNSDQQATLLVNYQQAYQAAAEVITTAHSMFESLINAV